MVQAQDACNYMLSAVFRETYACMYLFKQVQIEQLGKISFSASVAVATQHYT